MTVTEPAPTVAPEAVPPPVATRAGAPALLGSGDHKVIGRLWIGASLVFLLFAGVAGQMVSIERVSVSGLGDVVATDWFFQVFTFHSLAAAFLFLLPLTIGVATLVVPLQVGASTLAFARGAALAFWTFLVSGGIVIAAYAIDGGPFGSDPDGVELFLVAFAAVLVAEALALVCIATTVLALRAPGISLPRTPLFSWSMFVTAAVWLLTLPALLAMLVLTYLDVRYNGGDGFLGGPAGIYERLAWAFGQPAVYAFAIPVLGIAGEVVPVFSATRHRMHRVAMGCIGAFGVLAIGAWTLPSIAAADVSPAWLYEAPWIAVSFLAILPVLALLGLWADTARRGSLRLGSPFLYAVCAVLMLLAGLVAGAVQAIEPLETLVDEGSIPLYGTTWTTGVAHYVTLAAVIALFGAVVYWASKIIGRSMSEGIHKALAFLLLVGTFLVAFPDLVSGLMGQARGSQGITENDGTIQLMNVLSAIGGGLLILTALVFVLSVVVAIGKRDEPGDDPWGGHTLEWTTSSPPPTGNFATLPEITSEAPLYDARHNQGATA